MIKLDLKKEYKNLYHPSQNKPLVVDVPEFQYLMIDGIDARPESTGFQQAIQALFGVSYKSKFAMKKSKNRDYTVMPLEGLWWADDMDDFIKGRKENWRWTLMIMQPDFVDSTDIKEAIETVRQKEDNPALGRTELKKLEEGLSAQIMHIGPYSEEHDNIMKIHQHIEEQNGLFDGQVQKHHEIYLSDFRRTAPEKLKTILRQPFKK